MHHSPCPLSLFHGLLADLLHTGEDIRQSLLRSIGSEKDLIRGKEPAFQGLGVVKGQQFPVGDDENFIADGLPSFRISSRISMIWMGSSPTVGSSRIITFGSPNSAWAMPRRC